SWRGERAGARTQNLGIKSPLLYQLSYAPGRKLGLGLRAGKMAPASAAGRFDAQAIARGEGEQRAPRQLLDAPVASLDDVAPARAGPAAREAPRRDRAPLAEQRHGERRQRLVAAHEAVAAAEAEIGRTRLNSSHVKSSY